MIANVKIMLAMSGHPMWAPAEANGHGWLFSSDSRSSPLAGVFVQDDVLLLHVPVVGQVVDHQNSELVVHLGVLKSFENSVSESNLRSLTGTKQVSVPKPKIPSETHILGILS